MLTIENGNGQNTLTILLAIKEWHTMEKSKTPAECEYYTYKASRLYVPYCQRMVESIVGG